MPTHEFQIEVQPAYLPEESAPEAGVYRFAYTITVTNTGTQPAQLVARHWIISDARGHTEEVRGLGVVGRQPLLKPGEAFQYTSGCQVRTASGTMHGSYLCLTEEGETVRTESALFLLEAQEQDGDAAPQPLHGRTLH